MRNLLALGLLGLMTIAAPFALAQDAEPTAEPTNETTTAPAPGGHGGPCPTDVDCTGGLNPGAGSGGPCPSDVNCTTGGTGAGAAGGSGGTCMDGQQANESCDPDVRYLGGPGTTTASDGGNATVDPPAFKPAPALAAVGIVGAAILATLMLGTQRRR